MPAAAVGEARARKNGRPTFFTFWWNPDKFVGSAGLLQAYRFLVDSRDRARAERLDDLNDVCRLFRCRSIMNCTEVCPKGLNPSRAIEKVRLMMARESL
jgi:succinate dehydrogenase / fumarate reductase iron-sulfur subunit